MRYAIVTPYFKEPRALLERCIKSVSAQTCQAEHIVVADGYAQDWIDQTSARRIQLDRSHGDFGNTPRCVGAILAIAEQYDGFGFLDADNWLEPDHVRVCVDTFQAASAFKKVDYVIAQQHLRRPDESIIPVACQPVAEHVDTNCFFFFPPAYHMAQHFGIMPKELASIGDRIFYLAMRARGMVGAQNATVTVNYHCMWESVYRSINETPPADSKPNIDPSMVQAWIDSRSPEEMALVDRLSGLRP